MSRRIDFKRIENILNNAKRPVVACSFGKDSQVALHIIRQLYPEIEVVFNNTKNEGPYTLKFKRQLVEEWDLNLIEVKPVNGWTFWKVVDKYGFPLGQRRGASATGKCCYHLKKAPMKRAMKTYGWDLVIDGMTIYESRQRWLNLYKYRDDMGYRYIKTWDCYKLSPIIDWTPSDVWDYIEKHDLPYNKYYDCEMPQFPAFTKRGKYQSGFWRCLRVGCWACTVPLKYDMRNLMHLRIFFPKLHKLLLARGFGKYLWEHSTGMELFRSLGFDWLIENRPCYFDNASL